MSSFSERYNYLVKPIQLESMTPELRNRIWNVYYSGTDTDVIHYDSNHLEEILDAIGLPYTKHDSSVSLEVEINQFYTKWFIKAEWYRIYDYIEFYLSFLPKTKSKEDSKAFNKVLESENAGYRVIKNQVVPITDMNEISSLEKAQQTPFESVNTHLKKAIGLFSRRPKPDYENSIKESISAVEALCCIITGSSGANATLGKTIRKLKENGVIIHPAMENAFSSLYGFASDENGIRHGGIDFSEAPAEDAKYMLVSCSAFINYLIEKWRKTET